MNFAKKGTATIRNAMPSSVNNSHSNGVADKNENGISSSTTKKGAQQKVKKTYAPNLNVVRQKNKDKEIAKKTIEKNSKIIAARKAQHKPKDEGRYMQSEGLFSDGAGGLKRFVRNYNGDRDRQNNGRSSVDNVMPKPKVDMENAEIDKLAEALVVNDLLDCDDPTIVDPSSRDYEPVVLPLSANNKPFLDNFCATTSVNLFKSNKVSPIKETELGGCGNILFDTEEILHEAPNFLSGKYTEDNPFLTLIRLPDTFAAKGFSDTPTTSSSTKTDSEKGPTTKAECVDFNASMFDEGQLGKILVRKSGKIEIQIGESNYLLQSSGESTCTEQAMIIPNNPNDSNNETETISKDDMIVLGDIKEHLTLTPSWQQLYLDKMKKKKSFGYHPS